MKIRGAVLEEIGRDAPYAKSKPITVCDLELDDPGPNELLIKIEAAGICHSDLSVVNGARSRPVPMLLGHEAAGRVLLAGPRTTIKPGQRVVIVFLPRCGKCNSCLTEGRLPCELGTIANTNGTLMNGDIRLHRSSELVFHHIGVSGFATHAVVDERSVVPVPDSVPPEIAAVLGCAVLTGGGAVRNAAKPLEGEDLMIVGLGGVGMAALITAVALGKGKVIGVDPLNSKLLEAKKFGADEVYTPQQAISKGIKKSIVIEAAGQVKAFETAFKLTSPGGKTVTVGFPNPEATASLSPAIITGQTRTIIGSYLGSAVPSRDIPKYVELWMAGKLPVEHLISSTISLDQINEGMDALAEGRALRQIINLS